MLQLYFINSHKEVVVVAVVVVVVVLVVVVVVVLVVAVVVVVVVVVGILAFSQLFLPCQSSFNLAGLKNTVPAS